jgi:hypothetical protein
MAKVINYLPKRSQIRLQLLSRQFYIEIVPRAMDGNKIEIKSESKLLRRFDDLNLFVNIYQKTSNKLFAAIWDINYR